MKSARRIHRTRFVRTSGLSTIELMIAIALFAVVSVKAVIVMNSANAAYDNDSAEMSLEDQARRTLDQISYAIMGADRDTLFPDPSSPIFSTELQYFLTLGVDADGNVIYDAPEKISLSADETQVIWRKNPDAPDERRVAWCNIVRPYLEGELVNAIDDNANGVIDEKGLSFCVRKDAVTIRLSLERPVSEGKTISKTVENVVTIRN